ncbi:hypothetical protein GCM10023078_26900 [Gibbsiella greigii]
MRPRAMLKTTLLAIEQTRPAIQNMPTYCRDVNCRYVNHATANAKNVSGNSFFNNNHVTANFCD